VQQAWAFFNPKGTCPRWAESPAAPGGTKLRTRQFHSTREGGRDIGVNDVSLRSRSRTYCRTCTHLQMLIRVFLVCSVPRFPTYSRLCKGHAPLLIQKERARAGQKVQPHWVGQNSAPDSSTALEKGEKVFGKVSVALAKCLLHSQSVCCTWLPQLHALANGFFGIFPCFFLTCMFFSSLPNLLKVVQRARPSSNLKGTCPRWAEKPGVPGGTKLRTQQFHSTRKGGKMIGKVSDTLFLRKCSSQSIHVLARLFLHLQSFHFVTIHHLRFALCSKGHDAMFIASFLQLLICSQCSFRLRKKERKKGRMKSGEERRGEDPMKKRPTS
jgi:hypothetical protein